MHFLYVYSAFSASEFNNRESLNRSYRVRELSLISVFLSGSHGDLPHANHIVSVASKEGLAVSGPCNGDALGRFGIHAGADYFWAKFVHDNLSLKILQKYINS